MAVGRAENGFRRRRRSDATGTAIAVIALLSLGGLALVELIDQHRLTEARDAVMVQTLAQRRDPARVQRSLPRLPLTGSPDQLVIDGLRVAQIAAMMPVGETRDRLLEAATHAAQRAAQIRPGWGTAELVLAYAASAARGPDNALRARRALARSYVDAPFSREGGMWRIRYGAMIWRDIGPATRAALLREGVWLLGVEPQSWDQVFDTFRQSPAYMPFMLHWRMILSGAPHRLTEEQAAH